MPWSSAGLPLIDEPSPDAWPLGFAVEFMLLGPEGLTVRRLRDALRAEGIRPVGRMRWSGPRPVPVYAVTDLHRVCEALSGSADAHDGGRSATYVPRPGTE